MIPFLYTRYKKAPLATFVSFLGSLFIALAILFSVGYFLNWEGLRDSGSLGESLLVAVCFAAIAVGLKFLAPALAKHKYKKMLEKGIPLPGADAAASKPAPTPASPVERCCPKCGAKPEPGDVFCINCGTKLKYCLSEMGENP